MFSSSNIKLVFIQIFLIGCGAALLFQGLRGFYSLLFTEVLDERLYLFLVSLLTSLLGFLLLKGGIHIYTSLIDVKLTTTKIILHKAKEETELGWIDVEYIYRVKILPKHTYRIKLFSEKKSYLFLNNEDSANFWAFFGDSSQTGRLIKKRKNELNI